MKAVLWSISALILCAPTALSGQDAASAVSLARADSLLSSGEREKARAAYETALAADSTNPRALYQLARLQQGSPEAVELLRRYTAHEPEDAWGHWALAESLVAVGDLKSSAAAYEQALRREPDERDFQLGRARVLARDARTTEAIQQYERWIGRRPDDAEALRELAAELRRANRPGSAASALQRSLRLQDDAAAAERLRALRVELAPAVEPTLRVTRDSDGNSVLSSRLAADMQLSDGLRIGVIGGRVRSADATMANAAWEGVMDVNWRSAGGTSVRGQAGMAAVAAGGSAPSGAIPLLRMRTRWRSETGSAAEVRLQHEPVSATPLLLGTPVVLSEARGSVDLPLVGRLYARGLARAGRLRADAETNTRVGVGGGGVLRLGRGTEVGTLYHQTRYAQPTQAAYFAPERIQAVELTAYTEYYGMWPLTLSLDAGAGGERISGWDGQPREWERAFRLWTLVGWSVAPGREISLEAEAYDTRAAAGVAPAAEGWRWGSLALSARTAIR